MPENKPEVEKAKPRVIEMNEWVAPFIKYNQIPYDINDDGIQAKFFEFQIPNVGRFRCQARRNEGGLQKMEEYGSSSQSVLATGDGEFPLTDSKVLTTEELIDKALLNVFIEVDWSTINNAKPLSLEAEFQLPSKKTLRSSLAPSKWYDPNSRKSFGALYVPEVNELLQNIRFRIITKNHG